MIYLIVNETTTSGVVKSQLLTNLKCGDAVVEICRLDTYLGKNYYNSEDSFELVRLPILLMPQRTFLLCPFIIYLNWVIFLPVIFYLRLIVVRTSDITLRGYMAGSLSLFFEKSRVSWDPRSLFFHEQNQCNIFSRLFEKAIMSNVDTINVVSSGMRKYFRSLNSKSNIVVTPCLPVLRYKHDDLKKRTGLVYYGSLDANWNNKDIYLEFLKRCRQVNGDLVITVISQNASEIAEEWPDLDIKFVKNPDSNYLHDLLAGAKYGLFLYPNYSDAFTRYGVKFATYKQFELITVASENLASVYSSNGNVMTPELFLKEIEENKCP